MEDFRWKEFEMRVEAYRFYLNIALQTNVFFYAIAGVILGFYLNKTTNEFLVYALLLPILIASILGGVFLYAAGLQKDAADAIAEIMRELKNDETCERKVLIKDIPDLELLYILLRIFGWVFFLIGLALIGTPFLKEAPFPWWTLPPTYLTMFAAIGLLVLLVAGRGTLVFARICDKGVKKDRAKGKEKDKVEEKDKIEEKDKVEAVKRTPR